MRLSELGEFGLIARLAARFGQGLPPGMVGIGDDCAVIPWDEGTSLLVTTDLLIEGTHFRLGDLSPRDLGHKALAVNLSDIAAMGGVPESAFLGLGLPESTPVEWVEELIDGLGELAAATGTRVLGGDTTRSTAGVVLDLTVLGRAPTAHLKLRAGGRPGDVVAVTTSLGDSAAGLRLLLDQASARPPDEAAAATDELALIRRHVRPHPQLAEGRWLASRPEVHALLDLSDGLDSDLRQILQASSLGATIELDRLPCSAELSRCAARRGWDALPLAATGGEDYGLLLTLAPAAATETARAFAADLGHPLHLIGQLQEAPGLVYRQAGRPVELTDRGFAHF